MQDRASCLLSKAAADALADASFAADAFVARKCREAHVAALEEAALIVCEGCRLGWLREQRGEGWSVHRKPFGGTSAYTLTRCYGDAIRALAAQDAAKGE
jgi:hypothetical protein